MAKDSGTTQVELAWCEGCAMDTPRDDEAGENGFNICAICGGDFKTPLEIVEAHPIFKNFSAKTQAYIASRPGVRGCRG